MRIVIAALLSTLLGLGTSLSSANAEDYYYWPEFGTFAEHNNWGSEFIRVSQANNLGVTGTGVKVAVLDEGLADYEPSLRNKVVAYKNFLPGQSLRAEHGTMAASLISADYNPAVGIQGVAPNASLMVAKVCHRSSCEWEAIRKAVNWAVAEGAQVISMSFSGNIDPYMHATIRAAIDKGVVIVAALGNWGCNPYGYWGMNVSCVQGKTTEGTQATYPIAGLIGAGASDQRGGRVSTLYWSSSFGPNMDLLAPGTDISAYDAYAASNGFGGTSAATPYIAGAAALLLSINADFTPADIQAILQSTASKPFIEKAKVWDSCVRNSETNAWSCNQVVDSNLPQQYYTGAGVLNVEAAVILAKKIVSGKLLPPVQLTQSNLELNIQWDGGPADLYLNSELLAQNAESDYTYQGYKGQSISVQIRRAGNLSRPVTTMMVEEILPLKPIVTNAYGLIGELRIGIENLSSQSDLVWRTKDISSWYSDGYSAVFTSENGDKYGCRAYPEQPGLNDYFWCEIPPTITAISGRLSIIGKNSHLGAESDLISVTNFYGPRPIEIRSVYQEDGFPLFDWDEVPNALSYEYRYESDYILHCTTETSFKVTDQSVLPRGFSVTARPEADCTGNPVGQSESVTYTPLPAKVPKPTGITVKQLFYEYVEFEVPNRNLNSQWRIYRSDGLMVRINNGQRLTVGMQPNEDVNNRTFTYRFSEMVQSTWADSWSELSDPIEVTLPAFEKTSASCVKRMKSITVKCIVQNHRDAQSIRIEYLDFDYQVIAYQEVTNDGNLRVQVRDVKGAAYVRTSPTMGIERSRNSWYRRGEGVITEIARSNYEKLLTQKQ